MLTNKIANGNSRSSRAGSRDISKRQCGNISTVITVSHPRARGGG